MVAGVNALEDECGGLDLQNVVVCSSDMYINHIHGNFQLL